MRFWGLAFVCLAVGAFAQEIRLTQVASGVQSPTDIQNAGDGSGRLFFVQQNGVIRVFRNGQMLAQPFLDIRGKTRAEGERGLLGLAFPPGFAQSQRFYVNYTDLSGDTIVAQYRVTSNPDIADGSSEVVLFNIDQPFSNHNGGQLRFGPDGYLYIGMGDGGSGGDPLGHGQNRATLLGKMLRVDVESQPGTVRIPPDNPFAGQGSVRPEIWAIGLRNPWRYSFDRATGDLWIADVGQDNWEEVSFQPASSRGGENYGWNRMEGAHCYRAASCNMSGLVLPVAEYSHADGCSITGGSVYRGRMSPGLRGTYIYGDLCTGRIWGVTRQGSTFANRLLIRAALAITTFGEDEAGEVYVADAGAGRILRIEGSAAPSFTAANVVNAASFAPGLSPGSLATVFASGVKDEPGVVSASALPLSVALGGVAVTVGGIAAPVLAVANQGGQEQVNFQVPAALRGRSSATVVVTRDGQASAGVEVPIVEVQPAIYTVDGSAAIVVHNADYSLATAARPLVAGEFAFLYAAGLGGVSNEPPAGAAAPSSPLATVSGNVGVLVGGVAADVQFAGLAPGFAGVYQVNFRVPANARSGLQDLVLTAGGAASPATRVPVQ